MSRKRSCLHNWRAGRNLRHNLQEEGLFYFAPGCYYVPEVPCEVTPFTDACFQNVIPPDVQARNRAMYVGDALGNVHYFSDLEHRIMLPASNNQPNIPRSCDENDAENNGSAVNAHQSELEIFRKLLCFETDYIESDKVEPTMMENRYGNTTLQVPGDAASCRVEDVIMEEKFMEGDIVMKDDIIMKEDIAIKKDVIMKENTHTILEQEKTNQQ